MQTQPRGTLAVLFGGVLLGALDIAVVGPAMPAIRATYGLDAGDLSWILNVYILLAMVSAPLLGAWSDRAGRRQVYVACLAVFGIGSLLVALAPSFWVMLLGRGVQAAAAGGLLPVASAVIADTYPENRRGRMLGLIGAVFGIAFVLGPVLGAILLPFSWRWLFLLNLPLLAVLLPLAARVLPGASGADARKPDLLGASLMALLLAVLAVLLTRVDSLLDSRLSGYLLIVGGFSVLAVLATQLWRVELRAESPLLPPKLLTSRPMRSVGVLAVATGFVEATMVFLPTLAVAAFAVTPQRASMMLLPLVAALIVGSTVAGRLLDRWGPVPIIRGGMSLIVIGLAVLGLREPDGLSFYTGGLAVGLGLASLLGAPLRFLAQRIAGPAARGASQGILTVFLGTGRLAGAALIGGIVPSGSVETDGFRLAMLLIAAICAASLMLTGKGRVDAGQGDVVN